MEVLTATKGVVASFLADQSRSPPVSRGTGGDNPAAIIGNLVRGEVDLDQLNVGNLRFSVEIPNYGRPVKGTPPAGKQKKGLPEHHKLPILTLRESPARFL